MAQTEITMQEAAESLTGFEQLAIERQWKMGQADLANSSAMIYGLIFTLNVRDGMAPADAFRNANLLTLKEALAFFAADAPDEPMPDKPVTEPGKDDSQPEG